MALFRGKYRIESARLKGYDYSSPGAYFVTINTKGMMWWFGEVADGEMKLSEIGKIIADEWAKTPTIRPTVTLDEWQVMPNHLHGIIVIHESETAARSGQIPFGGWEKPVNINMVETHSSASLPEKTHNQFGPQRNNLGSIIRGFKSACTTRIHNAGFSEFAWQGRFWDRIIRDQGELERIRKYIIANPKKWGDRRK
ncbi:MAG: transposase [Bacteroidota bacterium]